ncbi:hypothetical protein GUJ93_ZPchr0005g16195 [Zizania palustris]|uniref:Uncharacterized protein n=1 Tax=Zizania palustris TaxID=103762 RepID=A0A8J5T8T1_ZIZPA|nr:hypothetical protein GUJ93_ZPchr0005g16195 [Zizania palustris]
MGWLRRCARTWRGLRKRGAGGEKGGKWCISGGGGDGGPSRNRTCGHGGFRVVARCRRAAVRNARERLEGVEGSPGVAHRSVERADTREAGGKVDFPLFARLRRTAQRADDDGGKATASAAGRGLAMAVEPRTSFGRVTGLFRSASSRFGGFFVNIFLRSLN